MAQEEKIQGFSKLSRENKIMIASEFAAYPVEFAREMFSNWPPGQKSGVRDYDFTENSVSDYWLPYSIAPNFLIDGKKYMVPMVTEESSVVAAASSAAKFWWDYGGFRTAVSDLLKPGHIHFLWHGTYEAINGFFNEILEGIRDSTKEITSSMKMRGGGIESIKLKNYSDRVDNYYQIEVLFNTMNAMGANFINTCLEAMAEFIESQARLKGISDSLEIIMSILSNYTPQCLVKCQVSCNINDLLPATSLISAKEFARRFEIAVRIAENDISRATTHNKGIFNGIDAVVLATGNDFRAVEAAGHSWACRTGSYRSLSEVNISGGKFNFSLEIALPLGVTGGITNLHPMTKASLQLLGNPDAKTLMSVAASAGLANHYSAIKALITDGIQKGHMKLHLLNILNQLDAAEIERDEAIRHFEGHKVSFPAVREFLLNFRKE